MRERGRHYAVAGASLGSTSLATNASGVVVSNLRYSPFGSVRWTSGALPTNRKFTGYPREDAIGGIDFAQARFYDSVIGRFLSPDTIYDGGLTDPQGLNRYSYVKGHVMSATDPTGHGCGPTSTPTPGISVCDGSGGGSSSGGSSSIGGSSAFTYNPNQLPAPKSANAQQLPPPRPSTLPAGSVRFTQNSADDNFGPTGRFANQSVSDVAAKLRSGEISPDLLKVRVFVKQDAMDKWPTNTHPKGYTGDYRNLENGVVYVTNNRSLMAHTLAGTENIPVKWATPQEIAKLSYEYSTSNFGTSITMSGSGTVVSLSGYAVP